MTGFTREVSEKEVLPLKKRLILKIPHEPASDGLRSKSRGTDEGFSENNLKTKTSSDERRRCCFLLNLTYTTSVVFAVMVVTSFYISPGVSSFYGNSQQYFVNSQNIDLLSNLPKTEAHPFAVGGFSLKTDDEGIAVMHDNFSTDLYPSSFKNERQEEIYVVREGDTLSEIANNIYNVSVNTVIWANDLSGDKIFEGQHLVILPFTGVRHQVKDNETIGGLAKKYKVSSEEIMEFNDIWDDKKLAVGNFIDVPGAVKEVIVPQPERVAVAQTSSGVTYSNQSVSAASGYFMRPVRGGIRTQGLHGRNAVDIAAPTGTPIYAAASGEVVVSAWHGQYGHYIKINHPNGTATLYAHNSRNLVGVGQWVSKGDVIASMGSTGFSTGPHLHFEVHGAANPF